MKSILFWYYQSADICENRLQDLTRLNPGVPIYGLFGGHIKDFESFDSKLSCYLNDNWCYPAAETSKWKWRNGDKLLVAWYLERGINLKWDSIIVTQWDMLTRDSFENGLGPFSSDTVYLPGLRQIDEIINTWAWTAPGSSERGEYDSLVSFLKSEVDFDKSLKVCNFIMAVLPKEFMHKYSMLEDSVSGFLEYKIPSFAAAWGYKLEDIPKLLLTWDQDQPSNKKITMSATATEINPSLVYWELFKPNGIRFFHPVFRRIPHSLGDFLLMLVSKIKSKLNNANL